MYRLILLSLLIIFLAACMPSGYYGTDPELAAIDAQARADALSAQAAIVAQRTQEAVVEATRIAELDLARRNEAAEAEIALIEARAVERREAVMLQVTEQAVWSAAATATAAPLATQQAWIVLQTPLAATQQAVTRQAQDEEAKSRALQAVYDYGPILLGAVTIILALALAIAFIAYLHWASLRKNVIYTPFGLLIYTPTGPLLMPGGDRPRAEGKYSSEIVDYSDLPAVDISPGRSYAQFDTAHIALKEDEKERAQVLQFLDDAIEIEGSASSKVPGWREMAKEHSWNSDSWQKAKGWMEARGLVESNGNGTFVTQFSNLQELQFSIATGQVK